MKAGIFDPYLDTLGGGERYCLTLAEALLKKNWQVDIFWPDKLIAKRLTDRFGLDLNQLNFVNYSPHQKGRLGRYLFERQYRCLFYFSDGSIPFMFGKNNWLHFQVPFTNIKNNFLTKMKLATINKVICNSKFTQKVIDRQLMTVKSVVVYPPVSVNQFKPGKKENIILAVGRFSQLLQGKKQEVLIDLFKNMIDKGLSGWKLILAGGSEIGADIYLKKIKLQSKGYPVEIKQNPLFTELTEIYSRSAIFWSASGYGVNETIYPEKVEHFGMTTVEAMASGCVPVVIGKGGQKEIIEDGKNGFLCDEKETMIDRTKTLIDNRTLAGEMLTRAVLRAGVFSTDNFYKRVYEYLDILTDDEK